MSNCQTPEVENAYSRYNILKSDEGKPFYKSLTDFMSFGPCIVMILEGEDAVLTKTSIISGG